MIPLKAVVRKMGTARQLLAAGDWSRLWEAVPRNLSPYDFSSVPLAELGLDPATACHHSPTDRRQLRAFLRQIRITAADSVVDIGCGKGAALLTLARFPFGRIGGVDISPALLEIARDNARKAGIPVELWCMDAGSFVEFDNFTHVYMYNPFPAGVMQAVLRNITAAIERSGNPSWIVYRNPVCHDVILEHGFSAAFHWPAQLPIIVYHKSSTGGRLLHRPA
jgi:SAM-dependent methyltransferase